MLVGLTRNLLCNRPRLRCTRLTACAKMAATAQRLKLMLFGVLASAQLPQERGGTAPSTAPMEKAKSWLPSMFQRSKHAAKQKEVMKKLKNNLRCTAGHQLQRGLHAQRREIVRGDDGSIIWQLHPQNRMSCWTPALLPPLTMTAEACAPQRGAAAGVRAGLPRVPADFDTRPGKLRQLCRPCRGRTTMMPSP